MRGISLVLLKKPAASLLCGVVCIAFAADVFSADARHAMVVTRETQATGAGVAVPGAGGNAADAAVAVALVENTASPDTIELLKQRGHTVCLVSSIGEVAAIRIDGQWIEGAPDGRTESTARGY